MKSLSAIASVAVVFLLSGAIASAQVSSSSFSTGGVARSSASGIGNTNLNAVATAANGGYAEARMTGVGLRGGYATGSAIAATNGGVAIAHGNSDARGWGAITSSNAIAGSNFGTAIAIDSARARGNALATSTSGAFTTGGLAIANSAADARGRFGGRGVANSTAISAVDYGVGISHSRASSRGLFGGVAASHSGAYSVGLGGFRSSSATATSGAMFGGVSHSEALHIAP